MVLWYERKLSVKRFMCTVKAVYVVASSHARPHWNSRCCMSAHTGHLPPRLIEATVFWNDLIRVNSFSTDERPLRTGYVRDYRSEIGALKKTEGCTSLNKVSISSFPYGPVLFIASTAISHLVFYIQKFLQECSYLDIWPCLRRFSNA